MDEKTKEIIDRTASTVILIVCTCIIQNMTSDAYWYAKRRWFYIHDDELGLRRKKKDDGL